MIVDNIIYAHKYFGIDERLEKIFSALGALNEESAVGSMEYDGFRIGVSECETFDKAEDGGERSFEAHRKYADIHYVISGDEGMGYADIDSLEPLTEYNDDQDYQLLHGEVNSIHLRKGDFCLVFPEDAHIPQMTAGSAKHLKKAVVKFKL